MLALLLLLAPQADARPTSGGQFGYDETDVLTYWDEPSGLVRVHYSVEGTNKALLTDNDDSGVPDMIEMVGLTTVEVYYHYTDTLGLRPALPESATGSPIGGSGAFDVYLVDFGGNADGHFGVDRCVGGVCSGYLVIENDFKGYGYPSLQAAVDLLTSHELFHGVQYAYTDEMPVWMSEGTATWGGKRFDEGTNDFLYFAGRYLEDAGRSLHRPPGGPVPAFAYGTALYFDFLTLRLGHEAMADLLEAQVGVPEDDVVAALDSWLDGEGDPFSLHWPVFARYNLATWPRDGDMTSHPYAGRIGEIPIEGEGADLDDENRFYPLAASYYRLEHGGGPIAFYVGEADPDLVFSLHPVVDGASDGDVLAEVATWSAEVAEVIELDGGRDFAQGGYWLVGTLPVLADSSTRVRFCLGTPEHAATCAPADTDPGDTGDTDTGDDSSEGCSCAAAPAPMHALWGLTIGLLALLRRRAHRL